MNRTEKEKTVERLNQSFTSSKFISLVSFKGLNVAEITSLRNDLRESQTEFRVIKNTLARRAIVGTGLEKLEEHFYGSTAVALNEKDPIGPSKVLTKYAKENPSLALKAGLLEGKPLSVENIENLSKLPPKEVLYSMLLGTMKSPSSNLVNVLAGILRKFMGTLKAIEEQKANPGDS